MIYKKLVIESLNELRNFEHTKDPLGSLDIGLQRIKTIRLTFYKNSSIYLISIINKDDNRWNMIVGDLGHMKENVLDYIKHINSRGCDVIIEYLDKNDNEIDNDFYKNLNESYHFEKKKDPLDSLDIGLNYINKIKRVHFEINDEDVGIGQLYKDSKKIGGTDNEIKQKSKVIAKKIIKKCTNDENDIWIHIEFLDKNDEILDIAEIYV